MLSGTWVNTRLRTDEQFDMPVEIHIHLPFNIRSTRHQGRTDGGKKIRSTCISWGAQSFCSSSISQGRHFFYSTEQKITDNRRTIKYRLNWTHRNEMRNYFSPIQKAISFLNDRNFDDKRFYSMLLNHILFEKSRRH